MTTSTFEPILAGKIDLKKLDYVDLRASFKLDGIRAVVIDGVVMSRKLKPIPSAYVQETFGGHHNNGLDGELIFGDPASKSVYNDTYSAVMTKGSEVETSFYVFDDSTQTDLDYGVRYHRARERLGLGMVLLEQHEVVDESSLLKFESHALELGYEGIMVRKSHGPNSHYICGRSTTSRATLLKMKRFVDDEAVIVGFEEEMSNQNEAGTDAFGRTERSSHRENLVGKDRLGALVCRTKGGVEFKIGTGYTADQRKLLWSQREQLLGKLAKYKSFPIGVVTAPRFPVFLGLRSEDD